MNNIRFTPKYAIKQNVSYEEYKMHTYVYNLFIVNIPRIYKYNKEESTMKMQRIHGDCVANIYGEEIENVPEGIKQQISDILTQLTHHNIEYPDITGYNFIVDNNEIVWIIDFEHACHKKNITNKFILDSCINITQWNEDFA